MISLLITNGYQVQMFHNGGDQQYFEYICSRLLAIRENCDHFEVKPRPNKPQELVEYIVCADVVVSHRLHANILAYSYGVPSVGLMWDQKVASFFELTERTEFLIKRNDPEYVFNRIEVALKTGVDEKIRKRIIDQASNGLNELARNLNKLQISAEASNHL